MSIYSASSQAFLLNSQLKIMQLWQAEGESFLRVGSGGEEKSTEAMEEKFISYF